MCEQRELNHRIVISKLFHAGKKTSDIIKDTGYPSRTAYRIVSNLRKGKSIERKSHAPRADKICTKRFLSGLKWSIASQSMASQSMATLAKKRNVSKMTIYNAVRKDLMMKSFCRRRNILRDL